jgi:hypothetical protein
MIKLSTCCNPLESRMDIGYIWLYCLNIQYNQMDKSITPQKPRLRDQVRERLRYNYGGWLPLCLVT